jgi:osmotically-inducible protein OsmY
MPSDETLLKEISHLLDADPGINATHIIVTVDDGVVTLAGEVHSQEARWMANAAIKHLSGIKEIIDTLLVTSFT